MGGAQTGLATGVTAQFWNPAALASLDRTQVGGMHASWLEDLNYEWLGYARPMRGGVGSLSVAYFHMPSIAAVDEFDNPTGEFRVYDVAVTAGYARRLTRGVSLGANAKVIRQSLATVAATGPAVDLGAQAQAFGATFGAAVQNLGPELSFDGSSYPLPRHIRLGASRPVAGGRILLAADYNIPNDYYQDARVGTEILAHPNVALRVGYRHAFGVSDDPSDGFSYGLGLRFHQVELDYAVSPSDAFDDVHRLSFGYSFGGGPEPVKPKEEKPEPKPAPETPKVIASAPPPSKPAKETVASRAPASPPPAPPATSKVSTSAPAPAPKQAAPAEPKAVVKEGPTQFAVILPGYWSKESALAELKALELLGFRVKDAQIEKGTNGYRVRLAQMKSRSSADELASSLGRMSFRATVETVASR